MMRKLFTIGMLFVSIVFYSQTVVTGKVLDQSGYPLPSANVVIEGSSIGTTTNFEGEFELKTDKQPPFNLIINYTGFTDKIIQVTSTTQTFEVTLEEGNELDEVVISASRTPERVFESPVTIERFGLKEIKNTASADFYDGLENLKGVDVNVNSLTFKSVNTRGFAAFSNTRFMQLVDGMDNSTPALNFPIGNLVGLTETDVQSVELLPGAASALYGANAFNGILFMRSKNPFDFQGISGSLKQGVTSQDAAGVQSFTDVSVRAAKKFSEKFAAKLNVGYLKGTDWFATNQADRFNRGINRDAIDYDGVNVYGDEVSTNIREVAQTLESLGLAPAGSSALIPSVNVSRTGYNEVDLTNYNAESLKADAGFYYRPFENDFEISYVGKVGTGNTIYQGANRYNIKNFLQHQHKLEVRADNFFVRGYVVADDAGDSYDMVFTGININRFWKPDDVWFGEYVATYIGATLGGATSDNAHIAARAAADTGRLLPGTPGFQQAFDQVTANPDLSQGSLFQDQSRYYHADANYNFKDKIKFAEIQLGGSFRSYRLDSNGTIYTDVDGPITYSEYGLYAQAQKTVEFTEDLNLKITGSVRYDKSELFDGFFSPRLSLGLNINENHNIRASVQTGFRNPTTQDLFIGLDVGRAILIGGAEDNLTRDIRNYSVGNGLSSAGAAILGSDAISRDSSGAYTNSYTASSVQAFAASGNPDDLVVGNSDLVDPEQVTSFEVGYRGRFGKITVDASAYYNAYTDFLANENVINPFYGTVDADGDGQVDLDPTAFAALANQDFQVFQTYTNSDADINSYGAAIQVNTKVFNGFDFSVNYTWAILDFDVNENPDFLTTFNTPEHKVKASFGKTDLFRNVGFNLAWRWSDNYVWESTFGVGEVPAFSVLDAQVNYTFPKHKTILKLGAANLLADEYFTAFGTGFVGSQYYLSLTFNNL